MHFETYINQLFKNYKETNTLLFYKKKMVLRMEKRAAEIRLAGMQDEKVLFDLVVSLYPEMEKEYQKYETLSFQNTQRCFRRAVV